MPGAAKQRKGRDQLTPEDRQKITASIENMGRYLLWGKDAIDHPTQTYPPSPLNWQALAKSEKDWNVNAWQVPHFMGFYWWAVSYYRSQRNMPLSLPQWGRLAGDVKNLLATTTNWNALMHLDVLAKHFDLIRWMLGNFGSTLHLGDTTLSCSPVRQVLAQVIQMNKGEIDDHYERFNEGERYAA